MPSSAAPAGIVPPVCGAADAPDPPRLPPGTLAESGAGPPATYADPSDRLSISGVAAPLKNVVPPAVPASAVTPPASWLTAIGGGPCGVSNQNSVPADGLCEPATPDARVTQTPAWPTAGASDQTRTTPPTTTHVSARRMPAALLARPRSDES